MILRIDYDNQPKKVLKRLDKELIRRIMNKIDLLSSNSVPSDSKRLEVYKEPTFRIRIGKLRVLYRINYSKNLIVVVKIDKREKIY